MGRSTMRLTPTVATSGGLITGVLTASWSKDGPKLWRPPHLRGSEFAYGGVPNYAPDAADHQVL
jgi:hypothetical protein